MDPIGFNEFRAYLKPASGFQSFQFRIIENKLGVKNDSRVNYGKCNYVKVFNDQNKINNIKNSENEPSLCDLVERWLAKGCESTDEFIEKYRKAVNLMLDDLNAEINKQTCTEIKNQCIENYRKNKRLFDELFDEERYNELLERGCRRLNFKAFRSALCVFVNKEDFYYNPMFEILNALQEIDVQLNKWRGKYKNVKNEHI